MSELERSVSSNFELFALTPKLELAHLVRRRVTFLPRRRLGHVAAGLVQPEHLMPNY